MESLYRFIIRHHVFIVFLILEAMALTLIYKSSNYQQSNMMANIGVVKSYIYSWTSQWTGYFGLRKENEQLAVENTRLRNQLAHYQSIRSIDTVAVHDTLNKQLYTYISAEVISNSINRQTNYFIINVGSNAGVKTEMAVISDSGVAGIVRHVSANFATVMSVLNTDCKVYAKLKRTGHFGPLTWDGKNIREGVLVEVPQHASVQIGDTIVTSGYSIIFPEGINIGTVKSFEVKKGNFYEIKVQLSVDFANLHYVNVINSIQRDEVKKLEEKK